MKQLVHESIARTHNRKEVMRWADISGNKPLEYFRFFDEEWIKLQLPSESFEEGVYVLIDSHVEFHKKWIESGMPDLEFFDTVDGEGWEDAPKFPEWYEYHDYRFKEE